MCMHCPRQNLRFNITAKADLYDPDSGTWVTTASLNFGRYMHSVTVLLDGQLLITGGMGPGPTELTELYR